jgi:hypothetical protein
MSQPESDVERLAVVLHEEMCGNSPDCGRWEVPGSNHRQYYTDHAQSIINRLEPEIGIANVFTAARVILGVVL